MKVAVVGGGIAGLAAAWQLVTQTTQTSTPPEVTLFEPDRLGGKILTEDFAGHTVDAGADGFIARVPDAVDLCLELGIKDELVAPAATKALLWTRGKLRPLPEGLVLGVPGRIGSLTTGGLLSPLGMARAAFDLVLPRTQWPDDMAVADVVGRRFGRQVSERLVDPLLGGIHAGSTQALSAEATAPQLAKAARSSRSLLLGLRHSAAAPTDGPLFLAPAGGMGRLVEVLVAALVERGVTFVRESVANISGESGDRVRVEPAGTFDAAILATPAAAAAKLLAAGSPVAAGHLAQIRSASVVLVTFAYPRAGLDIPGGASGFLVPRTEGRLMTACSFGSLKWPHWSDPDMVVIRASAGRAGDDRPFQLDDETLVDRLQTEVAQALGAQAGPAAWRVSRWPEAFPQYEVGHLDLVARTESALQKALPSVALAGAGYRGSGIPACIASGRRAAAAVTSR
jgi:protoporphyrinogen/coproporphyrinogen III oxidase